MTDTLTIADVTADPVREERFPQGHFDRTPRRTISREWLVHTDGTDEILVVLTCMHVRGGYIASINNVRYSGDVWMTAPFSAEKVASERTQRYSKPRFAAFADRALVTLRELAANGYLAEYLAGTHAPHAR